MLLCCADFILQAKNVTIALAVSSIYAVDFSINVVQACCRSLIVDTLPIPLQQGGSAWGVYSSNVLFAGLNHADKSYSGSNVCYWSTD